MKFLMRNLLQNYSDTFQIPVNQVTKQGILTVK